MLGDFSKFWCKIAIFENFELLYEIWEANFDFFENCFEDSTFYLWCFPRFLSILFGEKNVLAMFSHIILKTEKNGYSSKNICVLQLFWKFFDIIVVYLKMIYQCLRIAHMTFTVLVRIHLHPLAPAIAWGVF